MVIIRERPTKVEERLVAEHWVCDLINCAYNRSSSGTLVERTTLFTVLAKMEVAMAESAVERFAFVLNWIDAQKSACR